MTDTGPRALRESLVEQVRVRGGATTESVTDALRAVPRHLFVPDVPVESAYQDDAIVTKRDDDGMPISSSSQPTIMAIMLDQLGVAPGQRVLEIGAGTGYNAALLAHLVGPGGTVVSIDIDQDLVDRARSHLDRAGCPDVTVVCGDGAEGFAAQAPYDRIIATVGVWDISAAWLDQLAPGGRLVAPLDLRGLQRSVALEREDRRWVSRSVMPCGFMRLRGPSAGPEQVHVLDRGCRLVLMLPDARPIDSNAVLSALAEPGGAQDTGVTAEPRDVLDGLGLWLAVREPLWCALSEIDSAAAPRLGSAPMRIQDMRATTGILAGGSLALLAGRSAAEPSVELAAVGHGPDGNRLAADLVDHVRQWDAAGRPSTRDLRVEAYPQSTPDADLRGRHLVDKVHTRLVLSWPGAEPAG